MVVRPVALVILDGWGRRDDPSDNAVALADTPVTDGLRKRWRETTLRADGPAVGLPDGQFGNSEVGHTNLGAGRIVMQELPRIGRAIADGSLAKHPALLEAVDKVRRAGGRFHLLGLVSPGGVHAHQDHAVALGGILAARGVEVLVHVLTDGRDTPPRSGLDYVRAFQAALGDQARIVTVGGRYFAMDRDNRWERIEKAWTAIVDGIAPKVNTPEQAIEKAYAAGDGDEFVEPVVVDGYGGMRDGDGILCFNFRSDRVRQFLDALVKPDFAGFQRRHVPALSAAIGMTSYSADLDKVLTTLFPPEPMDDLLGDVLSAAGLRQLRAAETEKYPHVTFFFDGGSDKQVVGCQRILEPSPKVPTYDHQPEMSAPGLTDRVVEAILRDEPDFVLLNFANPDMVGHTGILDAARRAVETVDACLGRVVAAVLHRKGAVLVTADHGNCEVMRDPVTGAPHTAHTTNPVPFILVGAPEGASLREGGILADVAPTVLDLLGVAQPAAMSGRTLLCSAADT
ncbi:MAG TPA: 2,3-bisphosphoglycerate-independent phosphoglycerate mutase [Geminicoccus sp.]|jgi:2,3-bisphosphoglycerate-independent phosphoglycerate mutase|uniref:2,3-bisphosphoglycerate-independent phosphoglycerate mutase n=1 Tax=Geminicoccus sp. TaxID=2024832 RepID=UPI002E37E600|nr:2,3-bisphosphoglycerate-independent phosphoglycerate mutase [Geminicoccus sp.]HEX2525193.1 2,3-bisphosphoglycerate-independent phosphoglycerate mutase [Geminicoccus sp.]